MCKLASFHRFKNALIAQNNAQENDETEHDIMFLIQCE